MADWIPNGQLGCYLSRSPIVIKRSDTAMPIEIGWFINGQVAESIPVTCDLEWAKKLAVDFLIDERIPEDELWSQAERRLASITFWNGVSTP